MKSPPPDSSSESESDEPKPKKKRAASSSEEISTKRRKLDNGVMVESAQKTGKDIAAVNDKAKKRNAVPFQRIKVEKIAVHDERLLDNSFNARVYRFAPILSSSLTTCREHHKLIMVPRLLQTCL